MDLTTKLMALCIGFLAVSCSKERCDEPKPTLEFQQYQLIQADPNDPTSTDSLILITNFTDCQGDISVAEDDETTKNLRTYLFEMINGEWLRFYPPSLDDTIALFAQIPYSKKVKNGEWAEGVIEQPLGSVRQNSDTIRFETYIIDRAGNRSETVVTPMLVLSN